MIKNFLLALFLVLFSACSKTPEVETIPAWYTNPPVDYNYFYAVGVGNDLSEAKNNGILNFRTSLKQTLDEQLKKANHKLGYLDDATLGVLGKSTEQIANTLFLRDVTIEKSQVYNFKTLVLLKIDRKEIFKTADLASSQELAMCKTEYEKLQSESDIKKFIKLKTLIVSYPRLAVYTQLKEISVSTYNASQDFTILKNIYEKLGALKTGITFYVLSDANSINFVNFIKEGVVREGLALSNKVKDENSLKLLITSKTEDSIDYSFMQSKTLLQATVYDGSGKEISKKQHTFIGKSRKSHKDAKEQSALSLKSKMTKLGIFDFIGLENKE